MAFKFYLLHEKIWRSYPVFLENYFGVRGQLYENNVKFKLQAHMLTYRHKITDSKLKHIEI